jgi:hydroxymethylglutaryl-CoA lyase
MPDILISEVGPRDGLQSVKRTLATTLKHRWIRALADAGLKEIEAASFVPAKILPQMADAADVVGEAITLPGVTVIALVPNLRGAQAALEAGAHKISIPFSASEPHSIANVRKTHAQMFEEVAAILEYRAAHFPQRGVETGVSTAFGCTIAGVIEEDSVMRIAVRLAGMGSDSIGLSDTTGYGNPAQVKRMFQRLKKEIGDKAGAAHLHNTRGQGLANVVAALDAGVTTFDASQGGIGGCPYAPGATGNIVTEDLVFLLESMGLDTGIDIDKLIAARTVLAEGLPGEPIYGHLPDAGVTKGFRYADGRSYQSTAD